MDDYDRENLQFLLNADEETLRDWYDHVDEEDHQYASELLAAYGEELKIKSSIYDCEKVTTVEDAGNYLKKYML